MKWKLVTTPETKKNLNFKTEKKIRNRKKKHETKRGNTVKYF
jgi:hypothetical protein